MATPGAATACLRCAAATWASWRDRKSRPGSGVKVDASDLVQETMLEAYRDFDRFSGTSEQEWLAWLRRILTHNAADFVRRYRGTAKRQPRREVSFRSPHGSTVDYGAPEPAAPCATPSQEFFKLDAELRVTDALAKLPPDYQEVVVLRNLERLPFNEVAQRMDRSRPAVQMLWMRAIKRLQAALEEPSTKTGGP